MKKIKLEVTICITRHPIECLNEKLQNFRFIQIHRSYIINIDKITKIYGNQVFIGDKAIPIGKTYKELFMKKINDR